jgi:hypothetical protein
LRVGGVSAAAYASLNLGSHVGDAAPAVTENRRRLIHAAALPAEPCWLAQVHGIRVADLDAARGAEISQADACFTRTPGKVCAVLTADCLPILLASDVGDVVAAVHAGWRGLAAGVIEASVAAITAARGGSGGLLAWLGPGIGARHFEVGPEVRLAMLEGDPGAAEAFTPNDRGRLLADLEMLARRRLAALGVGRVYGGGECTFAQKQRYFSHRRDGTTGRQATLIWRAE